MTSPDTTTSTAAPGGPPRPTVVRRDRTRRHPPGRLVLPGALRRLRHPHPPATRSRTARSPTSRCTASRWPAHLRHLTPFPANLGEVLARYRAVLVPEMNLGQLASLLRSRHLVGVQSHTKASGLPFKAEELRDLFLTHLPGEHS